MVRNCVHINHLGTQTNRRGHLVMAPSETRGLPNFYSRMWVVYEQVPPLRMTRVTPTHSPLAWNSDVAPSVFTSAEQARGVRGVFGEYCLCHVVEAWTRSRSQQKPLKAFKWGSDSIRCGLLTGCSGSSGKNNLKRREKNAERTVRRGLHRGLVRRRLWLGPVDGKQVGRFKDLFRSRSTGLGSR